MNVERALIEQLHEFETPVVSEALAALGCAHTERYYMGRDISLLTRVPQPMVGVALTLEVDTSSPDRDADTGDLIGVMEQINQSSCPVVIVAKTNGTRPQHECVIGDGMAKKFRSVGSSGFVTDGGARDIAGMTRECYPVFGAGMATNHATFVIKRKRRPVEISGVTISDGTLIHGDENGIQIVPHEFHHALVEACLLTVEGELRSHTFGRRSDKTLAERGGFSARLKEERSARCRKLMK